MTLIGAVFINNDFSKSHQTAGEVFAVQSDHLLQHSVFLLLIVYGWLIVLLQTEQWTEMGLWKCLKCLHNTVHA